MVLGADVDGVVELNVGDVTQKYLNDFFLVVRVHIFPIHTYNKRTEINSHVVSIICYNVLSSYKLTITFQ